MAKYKAYPEYKDSGVEWLGEIPEKWNTHSLKRSIKSCTSGLWGEEPNGKNDIIVLRVADFDRHNLTISSDKLTMRAVSSEERESRLLKKGDLIIEKSGGGDKTLVGCVVIFEKNFKAITSNFVAKMSPLRGNQPHFLKYCFSHLYDREINLLSIKQTTGIQNIDINHYLMSKFCFPDEQQQRTICEFLDYQCQKFNTLIAKQQQLIQLLKEKRQALISHAVTKGLDPGVPMKNSGIEWLGPVPTHWSISKARYCFLFDKGLTITKENLQENGIPCINYGEIHSRYGFEINPNIHKLKCVNEAHLKNDKNSLLIKGDIIFADTSEDVDGAGNFSQLTTDNAIFAGYHTIIARPIDRKNYRFLAYLFD